MRIGAGSRRSRGATAAPAASAWRCRRAPPAARGRQVKAREPVGGVVLECGAPVPLRARRSSPGGRSGRAVVASRQSPAGIPARPPPPVRPPPHCRWPQAACHILTSRWHERWLLGP
eukprot:scaffold76808_cov66-Phaeocystis_antarctica.AAC.3